MNHATRVALHLSEGRTVDVDLRDYLRVFRIQWRLVVLCTLLGTVVGGASAVLAPKMYQAKAQLFVSTAQGSAETASGLQSGNQFAQQRVKSYAEIIDSPIVTSPVVDRLGLKMSPQQLASRISATAPLDTVLIDVSATDEAPARAQELVNAVALQFTQVVASLETPPGASQSAVKVSVVREANLPSAPVSPKPKVNLALGLVVGLALGVGGAILRETLDTSIKGVEEVQDLLGLPTLGLIGFDPSAEKQPLLSQISPQSSRAEAFRQLRTNLQFVDVDATPRSIVVSSALPQDGKSTTTCNLAISLAQAGLRVVLVEADLRRPRLADYLGLVGAVGLTDVLVGRAELDDVLQEWGADGLVVLPSGPTPPNPSELLGSQHMQNLIAGLESRVDLVLIDAPPLLPVTDAAILATLVSGVIVILRAGRTTRDQAARAIANLRAVDAQVYGAVINMVPTKGPDAYRYNYYGYGYGGRQAGTLGAETPLKTPSPVGEELGRTSSSGISTTADRKSDEA